MSGTVAFTNMPAMLRGRTVQNVPPAWPLKDPADTIVLSVDWTAILPPGTSILLVRPNVSGDPALVVDSCTTAGAVTTLRLHGGTDGATASILLTAALSDGQRVARAVTLPVRSQGPSAAVQPGTLGAVGFQLTVGGLAIQITRPALGAGGFAIGAGTTTINP